MESHSERKATWRIEDYEQPLTIPCETREFDRKVDFEIVESVTEMQEDELIFAL